MKANLKRKVRRDHNRIRAKIKNAGGREKITGDDVALMEKRTQEKKTELTAKALCDVLGAEFENIKDIEKRLVIIDKNGERMVFFDGDPIIHLSAPQWIVNSGGVTCSIVVKNLKVNPMESILAMKGTVQ